MKSDRQSKTRRVLAWSLVLAMPVLCLIPFLDKAFHIDDPMYIWAAHQIQKNPADFYGFYVHWNGESVFMAKENRNPPGVSYLIAFAGLLPEPQLVHPTRTEP